MKNPYVYIIKILLLVFFWNSTVLADAVPSKILTTPNLIKALQSGGHIIYMRHGKTNTLEKDSKRRNFKDCKNQRNLSKIGREQTAKIGQAIRALRIPIGKVLSSPYCRCKETANITFGRFRVEMDLQFSISKNKEESQKLGKRLYTIILDSETGPKNVVFVGHTSNLKDGLGIWPKPEGVVVVFQKKKGHIVYKGMIKPDEWPHPQDFKK